MSRDIAELSKIINLPHQPEEVWWETMEVSKPGGFGSNDWALVAVLRFGPEVIEDILARSSISSGGHAPMLSKSMVFSWYSPELRAMLVQETGDVYRIQGKVYEPDPFTKPPLMNGYMVRIGSTAQLFLYLYTM